MKQSDKMETELGVSGILIALSSKYAGEGSADFTNIDGVTSLNFAQ